MKKIGLTLGKFAPLHKGHQFMIETALSEMDELFILIYDAPISNIPLSVRADWLRKIYPSTHIIEGWDGPDGQSNDRSFEIMQENYILGMLNGQKITHFYSSEEYGAHVSKALGAVDRRVDVSRTNIPISATMIRNNPFASRDYIDDAVYPDLISKIVFLGAESTGKSTIAKALAERYNTSFVSEYGRDYWFEHQIDGKLSLEDMNQIALGHLKREEEEVLKADKYLFIDTNAITTYMFSKYYHNQALDILTGLADNCASRYDLFFLCETDIPFEDTWDRSGKRHQLIFQKQIIADLKERRIPYITLSGILEERMQKVGRVLENFQKYSNYFAE